MPPVVKLRILQDRRRKAFNVGIDNRRADKGKNALWRNKDCSTDKEAVGREEAGEDIKGVKKKGKKKGGESGRRRN
ncbi:hypothetical protein BY996DRAFT_6515769 [Phakopsora pachyrhizi]|nr:hypothetical protein BY996DRAFT_6515769 [Phakopsora pachyrhizi]